MAQSAFPRRSSFRPGCSLLLGIASSAVLLLGGCDTDSSKADKTVGAQLDDAAAHMNGSENDLLSANKSLEAASRDSTASSPVQLRAKALLADTELRLAQGLVAQILANDVQIDRLVREIDLLGNHIEANSQMAASLAKHEPTALRDALAQNKINVTGSDAKPDWYKSDAGTIASLAAVDSRVKDLQGKISALQDTIKSESDQRNQLLAQADKSTQASQHETGQKSVDLYVQGSTARKHAADLTVKIDNDNTTLSQDQADLGVAQGQHDSLTSALKSLDNKSVAFDTDWKAVQALQAQLNDDSKKTLGIDPVDAPEIAKNGDLATDQTLGSKASVIADKTRGLAKKNHDLRALAETHFNNAIGKYRDAYDLANKIKQDLGDRANKADQQKPDQLAWKQEQDAFNPSAYRFLQANAQLQEGEFFARSAAEARVRLDMIHRIKPLLEQAKLPVFPTMQDADDAIADQMKKAQASARDAFKDSSENLTKIYEGGQAPAELKAGSQVQEIFAQYGWYSLETAAGDAQAAGEHLGFAKNAVSAAIADEAVLPPLPPELVPAKPAVTPVPGTK